VGAERERPGKSQGPLGRAGVLRGQMWPIAVPARYIPDDKNYKGKEGNLIRVDASDNYKVAGVIVMILNAAGLLVESGMAVEYPYSGSGEWIYKTMERNPEWKGGKLVVRVTDSPGNIVQTFRVLDGG